MPSIRLHRVLPFILILIFVSANSALEIRGSYNVGDVREIYIEDIDNDQSLDVIVASNDGVYVLNSDVSLKWNYPVENLKSLVISDVDSDGYKDILISSGKRISNLDRGNFYALDKEGNLIFKYPKGAPYSNLVPSSIYATDLDYNGYHEIICALSNGVYALKDTYDGKFTWGFKTDRAATWVTVRDLDGDGNEEIIANSASTIYVLERDGTLRDSYNIRGQIKKVYIANILKTGGNEILVVSMDDIVHILDAPDDALELYLETKLVDNILEVKTLDLDGDDLMEVILGSKNGVYILNNKFMIVGKYETHEDVHGINSIDWDVEEGKEIVFGSGKYIYRISKKGELRDKSEVSQKIDRFIQGYFDHDDYMDVIINSGSKVYLFEYSESREFVARNKARRNYRDAEDYLRDSKFDNASESIDRAIRIYGGLGDTANEKKCKLLKEDIKSKIIEDKWGGAESYYKSAERYLLEREYIGAREELENARKIYVEINDHEGITRCRALSSKIDKMIEEDRVRDALPGLDIFGGEMNIFFIFSIFLLIVIIILLASLMIKRKSDTSH